MNHFDRIWSGNLPVTTGIAGWGMSLPATIRTNADLEKSVDTSDEWIQSRTGIRERRIANDSETTALLAIQAGQQAIDKAGVPPTQIDLVIVATITPDYGFPAVANVVQHALGATNAAAFDINAACTGFVYGLTIADGLIQSGYYRTILLIGAETMSRIVDWTDRATCVLFGDGAGAVVLRASQNAQGILGTTIRSDGGGAHLLFRPGTAGYQPSSNSIIKSESEYIKMDGREVYKFAIRTMTEATIETLAKAGLRAQDVDLFIPHQANIRIIDAATKQLDLDSSKVFTNVSRYGNTSAASIPIALCEAIDAGLIKQGNKLLLVAFGGGLAWGGVALEWSASPSQFS